MNGFHGNKIGQHAVQLPPALQKYNLQISQFGGCCSTSSIGKEPKQTSKNYKSLFTTINSATGIGNIYFDWGKIRLCYKSKPEIEEAGTGVLSSTKRIERYAMSSEEIETMSGKTSIQEKYSYVLGLGKEKAKIGQRGQLIEFFFNDSDELETKHISKGAPEEIHLSQIEVAILIKEIEKIQTMIEEDVEDFNRIYMEYTKYKNEDRQVPQYTIDSLKEAIEKINQQGNKRLRDFAKTNNLTASFKWNFR